jgi:hypothetical protein
MSAPQKFVEAVPRLTSYFRWPTDMDVGLVEPRTRHYAFSVIRKPVCSAVRVFLALQVPRNVRRPLTLRSRQAHLQRVPQLRRLCAHNEQRSRVLLCRDAFAAYCLTRTAYFGIAFTSVLPSLLTFCCGTAFTAILLSAPIWSIGAVNASMIA